MKHKLRGFTLIEVLTVIMIIGILASVILVSMDTARQRAADVTIQNQVGQLRSLAEAVYTFENHYKEFKEASDGTGEHGARFKRIIDDVMDMNEGAEEGFEIIFTEGASPRAYCMYAYLVRNQNQLFCVDSTGDAAMEILEEGETPTCSTTNVACAEGGPVGGTPEPEPCSPEGGPCATHEDCCGDLSCFDDECWDL